VTGGWRILHSEELRNLDLIKYRILSLRTKRWAGNAAFMGEIRNAYIILDGKPGKKKTI
jgi:hypothetical protein